MVVLAEKMLLCESDMREFFSEVFPESIKQSSKEVKYVNPGSLEATDPSHSDTW